MVARCCDFIGAVNLLVIVHCVRYVRMTVRCATSAHNSLTYLAAKHGLGYLNSDPSENVSGTTVWKNRLSNFKAQNITRRVT